MIIPNSKYPSQTATDLTNYPQGKARNVTTSGDGTGTPLERDWINDVWGLQQALIKAGQITPSGVPDNANTSDQLAALKALFMPKILMASQATDFTTFSSTFVDVPSFTLSFPGCFSGDILKCTLTEYMVGTNTDAPIAGIWVGGGGVIAQGLGQIGVNPGTISCTGIYTVASPGTIPVKVQIRTSNVSTPGGASQKSAIPSYLVVERFRQ